jgi:hypothetical protein
LIETAKGEENVKKIQFWGGLYFRSHFYQDWRCYQTWIYDGTNRLPKKLGKSGYLLRFETTPFNPMVKKRGFRLQCKMEHPPLREPVLSNPDRAYLNLRMNLQPIWHVSKLSQKDHDKILMGKSVFHVRFLKKL